MSTATATLELGSEVAPILKPEIVYPTSDAAILALREKYLALAVKDELDKEGAETCDKARKEIKTLRCKVEDTRKELKADALEYGRKVDAEAKRLTGLLTPIEEHLEHQVDIVKEAERRRKEAEAKALADRFQRRMKELQEADGKIPLVLTDLRDMPEEAYSQMLTEARRVQAEKRAEAEKQEAERKATAEKLRLQEEENKRLQAELLKAKEEQLAAERKAKEEAEAETCRIQAEKDAAERLALVEKAKAEDRLREAELKALKEKREAEAAARLAESQRIAAERDAKLKAEREAAEKIADEAEFDEIKFCFPTVESAWVEIYRLRKIERLYNSML